jgi:transcriptional regulator
MGSDESTKDVAQEPLDGTLTQSKPWHAYQLKMAGLSLNEIADRLNYTSGAAVAKAIKDEMIRDARDIARLNYMQSKVWLGVEAGDPKSIDAALKIIALRTRLTGLDQVDATAGQQTVLVVGGSEGEFVEKLKLVAGEG